MNPAERAVALFFVFILILLGSLGYMAGTRDAKTCADSKAHGYSLLVTPSGTWEFSGRVVPHALNQADGAIYYVHDDGTQERIQ